MTSTLTCPKCALPNVRVSKKALSKSVRHQIRASGKEPGASGYVPASMPSKGEECSGLGRKITIDRDGENLPTTAFNHEHFRGKDSINLGSQKTSVTSENSDDAILQSGKLLSAMPMAVDWDYMDAIDEDLSKRQQPKTESTGHLKSHKSKISLNMRGTISKAFARAEQNDDAHDHEDEMRKVANREDGQDPGEGAEGMDTDRCTLDNPSSNLLVADHYAQYFREIVFRADDDHTEQFHAIFHTKVVPHGVQSGAAVKDGTGSTERDAVLVTTDESIYFYERLPQGSMLTFRDRPAFGTIAQFSLSDVCQIAIGFAGQRLRIDFVSESWSLITRDKQATYHFVQEVMPLIKVSRLGSLRRGTLKIPSNELVRLNAMISASKTAGFDEGETFRDAV
eukprot:g4212.t1